MKKPSQHRPINLGARNARPFKIVFDEDGFPHGVDVALWSSVTPSTREIGRSPCIGPSDMSAIILDASPNARHIGVEPDEWLRVFCQENNIPLPPDARHLRAREPLPDVDGPGFISGVLVRDSA